VVVPLFLLSSLVLTLSFNILHCSRKKRRGLGSLRGLRDTQKWWKYAASKLLPASSSSPCLCLRGLGPVHPSTNKVGGRKEFSNGPILRITDDRLGSWNVFVPKQILLVLFFRETSFEFYRERSRWSCWIFIELGSELLRWWQGAGVVSAVLVQSSVFLQQISVLSRFRVQGKVSLSCKLNVL
jgi:hypothetical protein